MHLSMPVLVAIGIAFLLLIFLALRRRGGGERDLIAPPPMAGTAPSPLANAPTSGELPAHLEREVRALLAAGNKIEAIKQVRIATSMGLREAKELVERM